MTSLRMRVVEAGARALSEVICGDEICTLDDGCMADHETEAEAALDAMLDCLTENMNEWIAEERQLKADAWSGATIEDVKPLTSVYVVHDLIATLREPTDG